MSNIEKYPWWGWLLLFLIIGAVIWGLLPDHPKPLTSADLAKTDRALEREAEDRCASVSENLMRACVASMREKIDSEYDERARKELGR
jgi:hypothetical protein